MSNLYDYFSRIPFLKKSYALKFLMAAFIGIHIPCIVFVVVFATSIAQLNNWLVFSVIIPVTALTSFATLFLLNKLLLPVRQAGNTLEAYIVNKTLPETLNESQDEMGHLIRRIQSGIIELDRIAQDKHDVAVLLSHDLRSPVSQIVMLADYLQDDKDSARKDEYLKLISSLAQYQLSFISDVLFAFKQESLTLEETDLEKTNLHELINRLIYVTQVSAFQKDIGVFNHVPETLFANVKPELMQQVFQNLLMNAIKFSYEGGLIFIEGETDAHGVKVSIRDEGMGFTDTQAKELFKKFSKKTNAGTNGEKSHGLGLYLVKKIVEKHKGVIEAKSDGVDKGAVFTVILPIQSLKNTK
jgi:signal transduction histidine kinase